MNSHLVRDLDSLRKRLLTLATRVEENMLKSVRALRSMSEAMADEVVVSDKLIDSLEVDIEEECMKILALHQPVASDLRFVVTVLKINGELEHIGDVAANMAKRVGYIRAEEKAEIPFDFETMTTRTVYMLKTAIDSFLRQDSALALGVCSDDEIVDSANRQCYSKVRRIISENPKSAMLCINWLLVSKSLERIADMCTNIAEDVIYMRHSIIARHNISAAAKQVRSDSDNSVYPG